MILFFNFAPIEYLGGAERQMYELFKYLSKTEKTKIMVVSENISGFYGKLVLGQNFEDRSHGKLRINTKNYTRIRLLDLIPLTSGWSNVRQTLFNSRVIYIKGDIQELLILVYFGGFEVLKRVVCGIRSPLYYPAPKKFFEYLHNILYCSRIYGQLLKISKLVHVINKRDLAYLKKRFNLKNVEYIPLHIEIDNSLIIKAKNNSDVRRFEIIFIGELLFRKGVDILLETIKISPDNYIFHLVGKGPMSEDVEKLSAKYKNCVYHGYLQKKELYKLISQCDVLFFPSRAEGFGGVILEAMQMGLKVIDSPEINLNLPSFVEYTPKLPVAKNYLNLLDEIYDLKLHRNMQRNEIRQYCVDNFSKDKIMPQIVAKLFN